MNTHVHTYVFVLWEKTVVPRGNPRRHSENMQTLHRKFWTQNDNANQCTTVQHKPCNLSFIDLLSVYLRIFMLWISDSASDQIVYNNKQFLLSRWVHTKPMQLFLHSGKCEAQKAAFPDDVHLINVESCSNS